MAILSTTCCEGREHRIAHARKYSLALTAVVRCIFFEGCRQTVTRSSSSQCDPKIGPETITVPSKSLAPLWRGIGCLVEARDESSAHKSIGAECIEGIVLNPTSRRWTHVCEVRLDSDLA